MSLPLGRSAAEWTDQSLVSQASGHLRATLRTAYPEAAALASTDPQEALDSIPGLEVSWTHETPRRACDLGGVYDGDRDPARITLRVYQNERRNKFTALHELGHHLLYCDSDWSLRVLPTLGDRARVVEEKVANDFAASLLLPDEMVQRYLGSGVTAVGLREMLARTEASATTCCVRALSLPGDRLVMLATLDGGIWYSDSNGRPYNPGKKVVQPSLATAAERALAEGSYTLLGGEGIRYASGRADTDVQVDVAVHEGLVFAVVTSTRPDSRTWGGADWNEVCRACGEHFQVSMSAGKCAACDEWKCPECRGCECVNAKAVICPRCWIALSVAEASQGLETHTDC